MLSTTLLASLLVALDDAASAQSATLLLTPATAIHRLGTQHCLVATVNNETGEPGADVAVQFRVVGANAGSGLASTDPLGTARHCYAGAAPGTDSIQVTAGTTTATATWTWIPALFADTVFSAGELRSEGDLQLPAGGTIFARGDVHLARNAYPLGDVRARGSVGAAANQDLRALWAGGNLNLAANGHVANDAKACGETANGDVTLASNVRIDGTLQYRGALLPSPLPPTIRIGSTIHAGCAGPADLPLPPYRVDADAELAGWRVLSFRSVPEANACLSQRTAGACIGQSPGTSAAPGSIGLPGSAEDPRAGGLLVRVEEAACNQPLRLGGSITLSGNVTVSTRCRIEIAPNTRLSPTTPDTRAQVVVVSESVSGTNDLLVGANFVSNGAGISVLLYTTGQLATVHNTLISGGGGALYGGSVRLGANTIVGASASLLDSPPGGFPPPANHPPAAEAVTVVVDEDSPADLTLVGTDADGQRVTYTIASGPAHGTVTSGAGPARKYTPAPDYFGNDRFTYKVNDGHEDSNEATVSILVREINDAPVAVTDTKQTYRNQVLTFPASDLLGNDATGPPNESPQSLDVVAVSATGDTHGTVGLAGGSVTYTPATDDFGPAQFTYKVCDNGTTAGRFDPRCAEAAVDVSVIRNRPPVATDQAVATDEDAPVAVTLAGTDPDGDPLTFSVVSGPAHGAYAGGTY
ncbi:MAG: Ig-like domain-containing protein, partial [Acidimicrobiales bacterium]